jgi:hypothetical protein
VQDRTTEAPGQRIGDTTAVANPVTSIPEDDVDAEDREAGRRQY